MIMIN